MKNASGSRDSSSELRWKDLSHDVFEAVDDEADPSKEWPTAGYAKAAQDCGGDCEALEKLRRVCEDLECAITLHHGPGTFRRTSGIPLDALKPLEGRCWREVLNDQSLKRLVWHGIKNFAQALKSKEMDSSSRRTGRIIHAVAVARLESIGEVESNPDRRQRDLNERRALSGKSYIPESVASVIRGQ